MSLSLPIMALGLRVPNASFSIGSSAGIPYGWTDVYGGLGGKAASVAGPPYGHSRAQRVTLSSTDGQILRSQPAPPGHLSRQGTPRVMPAVWYRASGMAENSVLQLHLYAYDAADAQLADVVIWSASANQADWTLGLADLFVTIPASTSHVRLGLRFRYEQASSVCVWDVAFAGVGWIVSATTSAHTWPCYPDQGAGCLPTAAAEALGRDSYGTLRTHDRDLQPRPHRLSMKAGYLGAADAAVQRWLWGMARGRGSVALATSLAAGGRWPLLVLPGLPMAPAALLCEPTGDACPVRPRGDVDPPSYEAAWELEEIS